MSEQAIRLTQYSHGAGCGCKISPKVLETILHSEQAKFVDPKLLVGNETRDDAAVYDLGNGTSVISTTDFFMPIVDNPFDFGRIAATNAISDIFAMGGKPIMAIAILGWPLDKLAPEIAREVTEGDDEWLRATVLPALEHYLAHPESAHTLEEFDALIKQPVRDYEEHPDEVYTLDAVKAELGLD